VPSLCSLTFFGSLFFFLAPPAWVVLPFFPPVAAAFFLAPPAAAFFLVAVLAIVAPKIEEVKIWIHIHAFRSGGLAVDWLEHACWFHENLFLYAKLFDEAGGAKQGAEICRRRRRRRRAFRASF